MTDRQPDTQLLERARAGDAAATKEVVMRYQNPIRNYVGRLAPDPVTADDLAQEVFLVALRSLDRIKPELGIRGYLYGIARNLVRSEWRRRARRKEVSGERLFSVLAAHGGADEPDERTQRRLVALKSCLKRLPANMREVIGRHYEHEQRCFEIAEQLRLKTSSVRSILTRARQNLLRCIQAQLSGAAP